MSLTPATLSDRDSRFRVFSFILYPESVPEHWLEFLEDLCIPGFVSPLHDKDQEHLPDGSWIAKKPHWHVLLTFNGPKTVKHVLNILEPLGIKYVEIVEDSHAKARYLCHLDYFDRRDKRLYNTADVIALGSANYQEMISCPSDRAAAVQDMVDFVNDRDIQYIADLVDYARENDSGWFTVLRDSHMRFFEIYIKSRHVKSLDSAQPIRKFR